MGFKAKVEKNGMSGELYFIIIHANDRKLQGISDVKLRSFESKELLDIARENENTDENGNQILNFVTDEDFEVPLNSNKDLTTAEAYKWIRENHYPDAIDVLEE